MAETAILTTILGALLTLGGGVIAYLVSIVKEQKDTIKKLERNNDITNSYVDILCDQLYSAALAIKDLDNKEKTVSPTDVANKMIHELIKLRDKRRISSLE